MAKGRSQKQKTKVLQAEDVMKSISFGYDAYERNFQRFKFKIGDMKNQSTLNYRSKLKRGGRPADQRVQSQPVQGK